MIQSMNSRENNYGVDSLTSELIYIKNKDR